MKAKDEIDPRLYAIQAPNLLTPELLKLADVTAFSLELSGQSIGAGALSFVALNLQRENG